MIKGFLALAFVLIGMQANANDITTITTVARHAVMDDAAALGLNLVEGESTKYSVDIASFIKGKMSMTVHAVGADGAWIHQDMDLGFAGKQQVQILMDPNTGEIKKFIVNGKEEKIPESDFSVVDQKADQVTVPKGTFDCIYIKVQDNKTQEFTEQWIDMQSVPVFGMVKTIAPSQLGPVKIELTDFVKK